MRWFEWVFLVVLGIIVALGWLLIGAFLFVGPAGARVGALVFVPIYGALTWGLREAWRDARTSGGER